MVKLATAREIRAYGPRFSRKKLEYINSGLYVFASILLIAGFLTQLWKNREAESGLFVLLFAVALITLVNLHDLFAHLAGIDFKFQLMCLDLQLVLVEFLVPLFQSLGCIIYFLAILFLVIEAERGYKPKLEKIALDFLIVGPVLWVLGSILNTCQIYERANGHVQILQKCVLIPFLMGSLLFLVGGVLNFRNRFHSVQHGPGILGKTWVWLGISGSLLFFIGGLMNVVKVFKMLQMNGMRLEPLRGGAQEIINDEREGRVPLILENQHRQWPQEPAEEEETRPTLESPTPVSTPYKDVLIGLNEDSSSS